MSQCESKCLHWFKPSLAPLLWRLSYFFSCGKSLSYFFENTHPTLFFGPHFWISSVKTNRLIFSVLSVFPNSFIFVTALFSRPFPWCYLQTVVWKIFLHSRHVEFLKLFFFFACFSSFSWVLNCVGVPLSSVIKLSVSIRSYSISFSWFFSFMLLVFFIYFGCFSNLRMRTWVVHSK